MKNFEKLISIGGSKVPFMPESKKSIDIELMLLNIPMFFVTILFSLDILSPTWFFLFFYPIAMRIFIGNHDRYHADPRIKLPRFLEVIAENFSLVVTPWEEPYESIKRKHIRHHASHVNSNSPDFDITNDPHSVFELGGITRVILSCLFYEEVQLFLDMKNGNLTKHRLYRFLIFFPLQVAYILTFGWFKFLVVFFSLRIVGFTAWFVFSWIIHQPLIYRFGFSKNVPKIMKWIFLLMHGRRVTEGCLHHTTHHSWPSVPYNQLNKVDLIISENHGLPSNID